MNLLACLLLAFLLVCAVSVSFTRSLLGSIILLMTYSVVMSVLWILLRSPDLALTEAAVGAGVTGILFFAALARLRAVDRAAKNGGKGATHAEDQ